MVETRVITTEDIFTQNLNLVNEEGLKKALEEENAWAEAANRERDRLKKQQEMEKLILKMILIAIGIISVRNSCILCI